MKNYFYHQSSPSTPSCLASPRFPGGTNFFGTLLPLAAGLDFGLSVFLFDEMLKTDIFLAGALTFLIAAGTSTLL